MAALKVRRTDAPQDTFAREAQGLSVANQAQIGPQLLAHTSNFLVMDYADGLLLSEWLATVPSRRVAHRVLCDLLRQAFSLDRAGIDHGNLRCVTQHVIIDNHHRPTMLDFSSASVFRRAANVTTLTQGLFWGTVVAQQLKQIGIALNKESGIEQLRRYKQHPNYNSFEDLLNLLV